MLIAITGAIIGLAGRLPEARKIRRELARAKLHAADRLPDNELVTIRGTVALGAPGADLSSPILRRTCVYWLVTFDEVGVGGDYVELGRSEQGRPFLVQSMTATVRVVPDHIRVAVPGHVRLFAMSDLLQPGDHEPALRLARRVCRRPNHPFATTLRVTEYVVAPQLEVTVKGWCTHEPDPDASESVTGYRSELPSRAVLSGTQTKPLLLAS